MSEGWRFLAYDSRMLSDMAIKDLKWMPAYSVDGLPQPQSSRHIGSTFVVRSLTASFAISSYAF